MTLAALGRETDAHPARHARHAGDVPAARAARDPGRAGRRDERRPRRARARRGLVRRASTPRTASRSRRPATASRCSRSSSRSSTGMWTTPAGERFTSRASTTSVVDSPALPKPVQRPRPPIIIGGWGTKRTPRLAARYADEFNMPFAPVSLLPRRLRPRARRVRDRSDRDPATMRYTVALVVCVGTRRGRVRAARRRRSARSPTSCARTRRRARRPRSSSASTRSPTAGAETVYLQVLDLDDLDHLRLDRGRGRAPRLTARSSRWTSASACTPACSTRASPSCSELWARIEELGFDWISIWDHFYAADDTGDPHCLEAITTHTALAAATERRARAARSCTPPATGTPRCSPTRWRRSTRSPTAASCSASAAAGSQHEYDVYGMHYGTPGERLRMLDEYIQCVRGLLTQERTTFDGEFFTLARRAVRTEAGAGAAADLDRRRRREGDAAHLRAQHADGWNVPFIPPDVWAHKAKVLDEHCASGRPRSGRRSRRRSTSAWRSPTRS